MDVESREVYGTSVCMRNCMVGVRCCIMKRPVDLYRRDRRREAKKRKEGKVVFFFFSYRKKFLTHATLSSESRELRLFVRQHSRYVCVYTSSWRKSFH